MEQGSISQPNLQSLDRLTGKALFFPTGSAGGIDLGDIELHTLTYGAQREKRRYPISRSVLIETEETVSVAPVFSIEGRQFHNAITPYILLASGGVYVTQSAVTGRTVTFSALPTQSFDLGARFISNVVISLGSTPLATNADYFLEANKGIIRFPIAGGIGPGAVVTARFDQPPIVRRSYTALDQLEFPGRILLFEMESQKPIPKAEWSIPGTLSAESPGEGDPLKHRKWKLRFSLTGQPTVLRADEQIVVVTTGGGGGGGGTPPDLSNVLVDETGTPIVDESGNYVLGS